MTIAVLDSGGTLVVLNKMGHANIGSVLIAQEKARSALNFKRPTKMLEDLIAQGGVHLRLLAADVTPMEGGIPLTIDRKIVGAIGVSGMASNQDGQVASAGVEVL